MDIHIRTIQHEAQRYQTPGDWYVDEKGDLQIRVSNLDNEDMEFLIADHELQEAKLCLARGIDEKEIMDFDIEFEEQRMQGIFSKAEEPGLHANAPYRLEHQIANIIEGIMMNELAVDPEEYARQVMRLLKIKRTV